MHASVSETALIVPGLVTERLWTELMMLSPREPGTANITANRKMIPPAGRKPGRVRRRLKIDFMAGQGV
jgi:hypothetical protein